MSYPFYLRVEHHAAPMPPTDAVRVLAEDAARLGMTLMCEVNGVDVMASPNTEPDKLVAAFKRAMDLGLKFAA